LNWSKPNFFIFSRALLKTYLGSPSYGFPPGIRTSQIILATAFSVGLQGISWKVSRSGMAIMSDSSIHWNPVILDPSNPIPTVSAVSSSSSVMAKLLRIPFISVNHSLINSTSFSCTISIISSLLGIFQLRSLKYLT